MEDTVGDRGLKNLRQWRLKLIDSSISCYYYILNSTKRLDLTKQENELTDFLGDIDSEHIGAR